MQKNFCHFQSNELCTYAFCTFWGVGITSKPPSGHHASVGRTQQSERLALRDFCNLVQAVAIYQFKYNTVTRYEGKELNRQDGNIPFETNLFVEL